MKFVITIYNKLDEESPYRSDIFDLFGTPDRMNPGLVGLKEKQDFKSLAWDWGKSGLKKICKFLYWQEHSSLEGFNQWYKYKDFSKLPQLIDQLLYVLKYKDQRIPVFVASVNKIEEKDRRIWFTFTPKKFVLLPPQFLIDYRESFFTDGREDSKKWVEYFKNQYGQDGLDTSLKDIFSSAAMQDQYHIIPVEYIDNWVEKHADCNVTTKPLFINSVVENKILAGKHLPTNNQVFWSIFSQYTGHKQVRGSFSIIVKGKNYSVTDIPVNAFVEKGYVYNHEVGVPFAIFQVLQDLLDCEAYGSFQENKFLQTEFSSKNSIHLSESHFLKRAEDIGDTVSNYDKRYKLTDYDYVLDLSPLGTKRKIAYDLTNGLWRKGYGKTKSEFMKQWRHNLIKVPLINQNIITLWYYGLTEFEPYENNDEIGKWLIHETGLKESQYLYLDQAKLNQPGVNIPEDLKIIFLPMYDGNSNFVSLKSELGKLDTKVGINKVKSTEFYKINKKLINHLING